MPDTDPPERWRALGHGYRVEARITIWRGEDVLLVPFSTLFRGGDDWVVFIAQDGRAALRTIWIGHCDGRVAEVLAGLEAGDRVVLHPSDRVEGVRLAQRTEARR